MPQPDDWPDVGSDYEDGCGMGDAIPKLALALTAAGLLAGLAATAGWPPSCAQHTTPTPDAGGGTGRDDEGLH